MVLKLNALVDSTLEFPIPWDQIPKKNMFDICFSRYKMTHDFLVFYPVQGNSPNGKPDCQTLQ